MSQSPIELMFNQSRRHLLAALLLRPNERFHVRELGRMTEISAGTIHRELKALAEAGILVREQSGNQVMYSADLDCPIYTELEAIFRKTMGLADLLRRPLSAHADKIDLAFLFGSMASGKQRPASDIDICVLGPVTMLDVVSALSPVGAQLKREMNPVVMTTTKFKSLAAKGDRFAQRLLAEPKLFLIGTDNELGKLIKD